MNEREILKNCLLCGGEHNENCVSLVCALSAQYLAAIFGPEVAVLVEALERISAGTKYMSDPIQPNLSDAQMFRLARKAMSRWRAAQK